MPEPIAWSPGLWELLFVFFFGVAAAAFPVLPTILTLGYGAVTLTVSYYFFACLGRVRPGPKGKGRRKAAVWNRSLRDVFFVFFFPPPVTYDRSLLVLRLRWEKKAGRRRNGKKEGKKAGLEKPYRLQLHYRMGRMDGWEAYASGKAVWRSSNLTSYWGFGVNLQYECRHRMVLRSTDWLRCGSVN